AEFSYLPDAGRLSPTGRADAAESLPATGRPAPPSSAPARQSLTWPTGGARRKLRRPRQGRVFLQREAAGLDESQVQELCSLNPPRRSRTLSTYTRPGERRRGGTAARADWGFCPV